LDAALEVFAAKGFAGARVQEIADRAGVNKQLINYYFDSKEGLYRELQHTWLRKERTFADPELPLDELAARYLHEALSEPRPTRLMAWRGLLDGQDPSPPGEAAGDLDDLSTTRARQTDGQVAAELDPASVRLAIMGAVMVPVVMPQLVRQIFGLDPAAPEFEARYGEHLKAMIRRLSPTRPAQPPHQQAPADPG
jgi:TetR/AcrR family transcriptional regulator